MNAIQLKAVIADIRRRNGKGPLPVCAFMMQCGDIFTGTWVPLGSTLHTLVVTLVDREDAPPIYISVEDISSIAVRREVANGKADD